MSDEAKPDLLARIMMMIPDWLFIVGFIALNIAMIVGYKEWLRG